LLSIGLLGGSDEGNNQQEQAKGHEFGFHAPGFYAKDGPAAR
jgi:hypothetical protein